MGSWRRVVVDDFLPVDSKDRLLLPKVKSSIIKIEDIKVNKKDKQKKKVDDGEANGNDEDVVELWPFLLCKALLKVANLSWIEERETYDFNIISALTGWVCQKLNTLSNIT